MADQATADYLDQNVGPALAKALTALSVAQPSDPIAFLGNWLQQYADTEEANVRRAKEQQLLEEERAKKRAEKQNKEGRIAKRLTDLAAIDKARDDFKAKLEKTEVFEEPVFWNELINVSKQVAGANAVYIGAKDTGSGGEGAAECIRYDYASASSIASCDQSMTDMTLAKQNEAGEPVGVTWGVWEKDGPDGTVGLYKGEQPPKEGETPRPYFPVYIDCVTDQDRVHYFHMTRLGSYLAVPIVYPSYYQESALQQAVVYETTVADLAAKAEEFAEAKRAAEEAGQDPPDPPPELNVQGEPVEPPTLALTGQDTFMVLCLDTLGTNTAIPKAKIADIQLLCDAIGASKRKAEEKQVDDQAKVMLDAQKKADIEQQYELLLGEAATKFEKERDEEEEWKELGLTVGEEAPKLEEVLGKELKAGRDELLDKRYGFLRARDVIVQPTMRAYLAELTSWVVPPKEFVGSIAAVALLLKFRKEDVYAKKKTGENWDLLKELLGPVLFDTIEQVDVKGVRQGKEADNKDLHKEQKLTYIEALVPPAEFNEDFNGGKLSFAFKAFYTYLRAAYEYRVLDVSFRKKQKEAKIKLVEEKQAEEGGGNAEAFAPLPEDEDMDFDGIEELAAKLSPG